MFCFSYSEQCIKIISLRKLCAFISSVCKKIIPYNTTPTFQEVGGVTQHDRVCKLVTEIKDHAQNFPNAPPMKPFLAP